MAVRIRFDSSHNVIEPTLVLGTRSGKKLGKLPAVNISVSDNFNSRFELEFQVHKVNNGIVYPYWDEITDFKLVWCREWDVWFEMYVTISDDNNTVKQISCVSVGEAELSQINLYNIEINTEDDIARDDYVATVLYNGENPNGSLLHRIMEKAPHYTVKHVDVSIAHIQRTFKFDGKSIYDAFQEIAEEIDCIFVIDSGTSDDGTIERSISVYDLESVCLNESCNNRDNFITTCPKCGGKNIKHGYGEDTTIFVTTENLADDITLTTDTDSVKNCFRLEAGDDLMTAAIMSCNPNGSQYIWYITDDMKKDMSDKLVKRLKEYDDLYDYYYNEHSFAPESSLTSEYNAVVTKYQKYDGEIKTIPSSLVGYSSIMNTYFDTIDLYLFLHDKLMPSPTIANSTAADQAALLTTGAMSPIAVQDISKCSESTATSAILAVAKTIVSPRYQVKIKDGSFDSSAKRWTGNFTVTNYSAEEDTADSKTITIVINDDYETYVRQRIEKTLGGSAIEDDVAGIEALFKLELTPFKEEIKKYCLNSLQTFHDACQGAVDILIEQGIADKRTWADQDPDMYAKLYLPFHQKLLALEDEIKLREKEIATVEKMQKAVEDERDIIRKKLDMEQFLGEDLWKEFVAYKREDTYSNENYISDGLDNKQLFDNAMEFIEVAQKEIYKSAMLQHSLSATLKNLLVMKEFEPIVEYFSVGNWIRIKIDDEIYKLRLISYTIDFDNLENISVEFSDVNKCVDGVTDSKSIMDQAASMASSYDAVTRQSTQGKKSYEKFADWVENGLTLTQMKIINSADNQNVTWDSHGLLCREYLPFTDEYSDKQLKIINKGLYVTDDNWLTSRAGIGNFAFYNPESGKTEEAYGVIADTLVGNLILSERVGVYNTNNSIVIGENGFVITTHSSGSGKPQNAFTIQKEESNGDLTPMLYIDDDGNINLTVKSFKLTTGDTIESLAEKKANDALNSAKTYADTVSDEALKGAKSYADTIGDSVLSDANSYADAAARLAVEAQTQKSILDKLTDGGKYDGLFLQNGKIYMKGTYIDVDYLSAISADLGVVTAGTIKSTTITGNTISGNTISGNTITGGTITGTTLNNGSGTFSVSAAGKLTAKNADINGSLTAGSDESYIRLNNGQMKIRYQNRDIGLMGANYLTDNPNAYGITFDCEAGMNYMSWAAKATKSEEHYTVKWTYSNYTAGGLTGGALNAGCDIDMHGHKLRNVAFDGGGVTGTTSFIKIKEMNADGTVKTWATGCRMQFKNGILISATW